MSANSRMTVAIHVLSYMVSSAKKRPDPVTSDQIAYSVATNPVVIRRMLGLLQKGGLVRSHRGAHSGWTLARKSTAITLLDIYRAVEEEPACHIARGIQPALKTVYGALEDQLRRQLSKTTIEQVFAETVG